MFQQSVTNRMPESVVNVLEFVQVQQHERNRQALPVRHFQSAIQPGFELIPVRNRRQLIVKRQLLNFLFGFLLLGHIAQNAGKTDAP